MFKDKINRQIGVIRNWTCSCLSTQIRVAQSSYSSRAQSNRTCQRCVSVQLSLPVFLTCTMFDMCLCPFSLCTALLLVSVKTESPEQGFFTLFSGSCTHNHHVILFCSFLHDTTITIAMLLRWQSDSNVGRKQGDHFGYKLPKSLGFFLHAEMQCQKWIE